VRSPRAASSRSAGGIVVEKKSRISLAHHLARHGPRETAAGWTRSTRCAS
jgi:hypothetical protein